MVKACRWIMHLRKHVPKIHTAKTFSHSVSLTRFLSQTKSQKASKIHWEFNRRSQPSPSYPTSPFQNRTSNQCSIRELGINPVSTVRKENQRFLARSIPNTWHAGILCKTPLMTSCRCDTRWPQRRGRKGAVRHTREGEDWLWPWMVRQQIQYHLSGEEVFGVWGCDICWVDILGGLGWYDIVSVFCW